MNDVTARASVIPAVVEILDRSGRVLQRVPYEGGEMRIGRAYDNDIIVGDPYVCPHHLKIESHDGVVSLEDCDSANGSYLGHKRERILRIPINDDTLVHFGHSQLRFRRAGTRVAPARRDISRRGPLAWFGKPLVLLSSVLAALLTLSADNLLDSAARLGAGELLGQLLYPIIGILLWTGLWALINRVVSHRANFDVHLAIASSGVVMLLLAAELVSLLSFALGWDLAAPWLRLFVRILVLALTVYAHLRYATHGRNWVQVAIGGLTAVLLFGTPAVGDLLERGRFSTIPYLDPLLKPPHYQLRKGVEVEQFFDDAASLVDMPD